MCLKECHICYGLSGMSVSSLHRESTDSLMYLCDTCTCRNTGAVVFTERFQGLCRLCLGVSLHGDDYFQGLLYPTAITNAIVKTSGIRIII